MKTFSIKKIDEKQSAVVAVEEMQLEKKIYYIVVIVGSIVIVTGKFILKLK